MTIEEQIKDFISRNLLFSNEGFPYDDEVSFLDHGIIDSIGIMQLVLFVEENFNISIEDWEITPMNFDSITRLAGYVRNKMNLDVFAENKSRTNS
jgi:acyl carrier protein